MKILNVKVTFDLVFKISIYLNEFVSIAGIIVANQCESKTLRAFDDGRVDHFPSQLIWIFREENVARLSVFHVYRRARCLVSHQRIILRILPGF